MITKRTTKKAPAEVGAKLPKLNRLSYREIEAHKATGYIWGPSIIPQDKTIRALKSYGISASIANLIISDVIDPFGRFCMEENFRKNRLAPSEMVKQALDTSNIAKELGNRIHNMEPHIRAEAVGKALATWGEEPFSHQLELALTRIAALLNYVAKEFEKLPSKVPKRTGSRNSLLAQVVGIIDKQVPGLTRARTREIAVALLTEWGVQAPQDDNKVKKAIRTMGAK